VEPEHYDGHQDSADLLRMTLGAIAAGVVTA
jgi:hypothetical protein